ncbi:MAG: response regulator [Chloroflexi bacterium]|nr:MAG: response regulator [Chloroflexota bacterium]
MGNQPRHLLLVEDNPAHQMLVQRAFENHPAPVTLAVARTLAEARQYIETTTPDLIIAELRLPDGDSITLLPSEPELSPFPVVILTSQGDELIAVETMKRGALDYLVKSERVLADLPIIASRLIREWKHLTERDRAQAQLRQNVARLTLVNQISTEIGATLNLQDVFEKTTRLIQTAFDYHHVAVLMISGQNLVLKAIVGYLEQDVPSDYTVSLSTGICGWVASHGEKIVANDVSADPRYYNPVPHKNLTAAELCLPLKVGGKTIGVLDIESPHRNTFSQNDSLTLEILTDRIAAAIENARLYQAVAQELEERKQAEAAKARLEDQLRQAQKMETIGTLTAGIAHDFNNLLTAINGFAEVMKMKSAPGDPNWKAINMILDSGNRAANLVQQLLAFSRKQIIQPQVINLNTVVETMNSMLRRIIGENIHLELDLDPDLWNVKVDKAQMEQVIVNLAVNSRDAMPGGGRLVVKTRNTVLDQTFVDNHLGAEPGPHVCLTVTDTGHGMEPEILAHIFEPFYTTKEMGSGTGLGLATVFGIIKQSHGNIWASSQPGQGATFEIYLPVAESNAATTPNHTPETSLPTGTETILIAEDDEGVRDLACSILKRYGYRLLVANDVHHALTLGRTHPAGIHLLLTDVIMPDMNGKELADALRPEQPQMKVIYMSGYINTDVVKNEILPDGTNFIPKPFSYKNLLKQVRQILDAPPPFQH